MFGRTLLIAGLTYSSLTFTAAAAEVPDTGVVNGVPAVLRMYIAGRTLLYFRGDVVSAAPRCISPTQRADHAVHERTPKP